MQAVASPPHVQPRPAPSERKPGRRAKPPSYRLHKPTGQGVVTLNGKDFYLGLHGTPDSREAYDRRIAEWYASGRQAIAIPAARKREAVTVNTVVAAFVAHAEGYYVDAAGHPTSELACCRQAIRPLQRLYGQTSACNFGPLALKAVRQEMIRMGWSRKNLNKQVNRLRSLFKWAASQELIPASVFEALRTLGGLQPGRGGAKETLPIRPAAECDVEAVRPFVSRQVWALIQLQLLTGARAGELVKLRPVDINTSGDVWTYTPAKHKTAHHGHTRTIFIGPKGQEVVRPFLRGRPVDAFLFSPREAEAERREKMHAKRRESGTRLSCGNVPGSNRQAKPKHQPGDCYDVASYRRAIDRACDKADEWAKGGRVIGDAERIVGHWHPHQLRHNAATYIRREFGLESSKVILGHRSLDVTQLYAEADQEKARDAIRRIG